ncbi:MAG: pyruvate dehydrogenase complex dihydrolipoamide acetyltransferase [Hyphomonadaceae bacterium]|nr:MAG: pyruvate dehydrogenase E2 component (dihydrolipoamide acetyltransferase) [Caulobacteraceae bacterium]MBT9445099.1 pyruvate dehydrogenase complex dihydrolipoamide acetyltransferase [Hyphomonadaceae bacterium]TPW08422.1 MAG: pyruvate dehydrogenase E2 component (dihydrolipoamide acetyltransferase) [Alphaproteobacteria bacterium]
MTDILMPALSPTMEEGGLAKWLVKPGDTVTAGQVIAEIETDKATMEVEAVDEGVVEALLVEAGAQGVKVNTPIARLKAEGGAPAPKNAPPLRDSAPKAETPKAVAEPARAPSPVSTGGDRIVASPLAKRIAQQAGIDLSGLAGSGPGGRIVKADVEAAMRRAPQAPPQPNGSRALTVPQQAPVPKTLEQLGIAPGSYDLVPLDMMRKTIARRLTDSFRDIPHFPLTIDLEIDRLLKARGEINARFADHGVKISVNDIIIKACALALTRVPDSNASYTPEGIALHHHADVAVAVAIDGGLITPIIRQAETKGLAAISAEMADLAARARDRKLKPHEYQGGTFSLSNLGMMGIKSFSSILNEPQGMIMSVGAGEKRPIVKNDALAIATVMTVTLTCDHRVVDGAIGSAFLKAFKGFIEDPMAMLL